MTETIRYRANPGPQESFLATSADMAFYGGAAGGGKSFAVLLDGLRWHGDPGFGGIILRRESVDLIGAGSIWEMAVEMYTKFGARCRENPRDARFASGASYEFAHLQHEKDKFGHQGKQYSWIAFEELTHFTETQFWYMVSRKRTGANMRAYVRATCNPDPDSFVAKMVAWWIGDDGYAIPERSGVIRHFVRNLEDDSLEWFDSNDEAVASCGDPERVTSFTFILSRLKDNPKVDPTYRGALLSLPLVERERLLGDEDRGGNWKIRPAAGNIFKRHWFQMLDMGKDPPFARRVASVRWWDKASTKPAKGKRPDWTVGVRVDKYTDGSASPIFVIEHVERLQATPGEVNRVIRATAEQDGIGTKQGLWEDPGSAGTEVGEAFSVTVSGFANTTVKQTKGKTTLAELWSPHAERGRVYVRRNPSWNDSFFAEAESFPDGANDDQIDGASGAFLCLEDVVQMQFTKAEATKAPERSRAGGFNWKSGGGFL